MFTLFLIIMLALLSIAAGVAKAFQLPEEVTFLAEQGLGISTIVVFGVVQILGGVLAIITRTRRIGLGLITAGFLVSALIVFVSGNFLFGLVSMLPVLVTIGVFYMMLIVDRKKQRTHRSRHSGVRASVVGSDAVLK